MFLALVFIILSIVLIILYDEYHRAGRLLYKIPGPRRLPVIGNSYNFLMSPKNLFRYLRTLYKNYGGFNQMHALNIRGVNLYNPEDIEKIMSSVRHSNKYVPYTFLRPWLGEGLLTSNGIKWHQRRKLLTQAFHFNIIKKYATTFTEQSEVFLKKVEAEVGNSRTNILPMISSQTLRIMCETAMGTSMNVGIESVTNKYFKAIEIIGEATVERLIRVWLYLSFLYKWSSIARKQNAAIQDLHKMTNKIIKERKEFLEGTEERQIDDKIIQTKGKLAMLDLLLENEKLGQINMEGIREEVDTFLFEGHDTTAVALSLLIMSIANEPAVQEKLYDEMEKVFGTSERLATMQDLSEMTYLECCIKESLRLYPSVPLISRYVTDELILNGYTIPANTHYQIFIYDLHRRADIYPEPERFIPDRFFPENCATRHPYAYLPFSAGPRNCIGQKFAMLEMKTLISSLIRKYRILPLTKPMDLKFRADLLLRTCEQPIYVRFCKRTQREVIMGQNDVM